MKAPVRAQPLTPWTKSVFALGDLSTNTALSTMALVFTSYFLVEIGGLRPVLAGTVPLIGRIVDAFTDPLMGRISDRTTWRLGRRRPYLIIGALPLGIFFALLWANPSELGELGRFVYYTVVYTALNVAMTIVSVPYLALQPEMALDYDERTSLNGYRSVGAILGIVVALGLRPLANYVGGGEAGFRTAGILLGIALALPWLAVYAVTFERPSFGGRSAARSFLETTRECWRQRAFRRLVGLYLAGRVAIDLTGVSLVLYFTHWLGRSEDFEITMLVFLLSSVLAVPPWLAIARRVDKATAFIAGSAWWMIGLVGMFLVEPDWPRWVLFVFSPVVAAGYAAVDLMPWAMLGEVVDEDELASAERREGIYNGLFTFLRKLAGAVAVFAALGILDLCGLEAGSPAGPGAQLAIRLLTTIAPAAALVFAIALARGYPLTRARHDAIVAELVALETHRRPVP
jgi:sugar (glycoside-pentoside-hexuronide) transporter